MIDKEHTGNEPSGSPNPLALQELLTPERLELIRNSPERMAIVKELLVRDPEFLANAEAVLQKHGTEIDPKRFEAIDLASVGWTPTPLLPSPKQAAAAIGAAAALLVL